MVGCQQGKSLYIAMISKAIKRIGKSAPFANGSQRESQYNTSKRTAKNSLMMRQPEGMNYEKTDVSDKKPRTFQIDKQMERVDAVE